MAFLVLRFIKNNADWFTEHFGGWLHGRVVVSRFYRKRALRRYQKALLERYRKLSAPIQQLPSFDLRDIYVPLKLSDGTPEGTGDAFRAVLEYRRLVIIGPPGSGKSTLLKVITRTFAEGRFAELPDEPVPVLLVISNLANSKGSLKEQLIRVLADNGLPEGESLLPQYLERGKLMLLLDGLDEVHNDERRDLVGRVRELMIAYPGCRFIVTSRAVAYGGEFDGLAEKTLTLVEFDEQQIRQFLQLHMADPPEGKSVEQFMWTLRENHRVLALARNPLMLTLLAYLYTATGFSLGHSVAEFYERSTDVLLRGWTREPSSFMPLAKRLVLEEIALYAQDGRYKDGYDDRSIARVDAVKRVQDLLPKINLHSEDSPLILDEIVQRSGLLLLTEHDARYQFSHLSFQEFFAAAKLRDDPEGLLRRYTADPGRWRESLRLWCGLSTDSTRLIQNLYRFTPITALECLADAQKVDRGLANEIINDLKDKLANFADEGALERAFGAVASSPHTYSKKVFRFLEETLASSGEPSRRLAAARALSFANMKQSAQVLANHYTELAEMRSIIVRMGDTAVSVLTNLARDGSIEALDDLRAIGTPSALESFSALIPLLGQRIESLMRKPSIKVEFESRSGFYVNRTEMLRLKITSLAKEPLRDVVVELDDTPIYSVNATNDLRSKKLVDLREGETQIVEYPIRVTRPGLITLQLKIDGEIYKEHPLEINAVKDNPYSYGPPVRSTNNFFGRENELQTSLNNIMSPAGAHTMIIGEQRSGKTSLLYQIRDRLDDPYVPVFISFSGIERQEKTALAWLLHQIIEELKKKNLLKEKNYFQSMEYGSDFTKHLAEIIRDMKGAGTGPKLVLLLDEAHLMNEIGEKFQEILREAFLQLIEHVRVVLACYYDFFDDLKVSGSPLHNIFEFIFLKPLAGNDLRMLIVEPAARFGFNYEASAIEAIRITTGGHPYYCQYLCASSLLEAEKESITTISSRHVDIATHHVLTNDKQKFQLGYWNNMKAEERDFLTKLVRNYPIAGTSKQVINRLRNKFLIEESNDSYSFTARLFKEWTKQLIQEDS